VDRKTITKGRVSEMNGQTVETRSIAVSYKYGLLAPMDWGDDCEEEILLQAAFWNRLVELENSYRQRVRAVECEDPNVVRLETERLALVSERERLNVKRNGERQAARSKIATPAIDRQIADVSSQLKGVAARCRETRRLAHEARREQLRLVNAERYMAVSQARRESGLFWSNYNAVIESYEVARQQTLKRGVDLRLKRRSGNGRITNQIQGGIRYEDLMAGRHSQVRIGPPPPGMRNKRGASLTMTVHRRGGIRRNVTWPIILHRPLPADAIIKVVVVHRRRRSDRWIWSAVFVCSCRADASERTGPRVAVNIGWRNTPAGIRVACILSEGDISPQYVMLPNQLAQGVQLCDKETSERDKDLNTVAALIRALDLAGMPSELAESTNAVREARRHNAPRFVRLLRDWREFAPNWRPADLEMLDDWARRDRRRWHNREERRAWVSDAREYHYRQEVRRLLGRAREILINAHDMSETARVKDSELPLPARRLRFIAAPSVFRLVLLNYARKTGIRVTVVERPHDTCVFCGGQLAPPDRAALWWKCDTCGCLFDQDEHYCRLLLVEPPYGCDA